VKHLVLRPATRTDARLLWEWRNDPVVRRHSFSSDEVRWDEHCAWLARKLASADHRLWILESGHGPVGQIRYERTDEWAEISFSVAAEFRGRGLGQRLLELSAPRACLELSAEALVAFVKADNVPSVRAFVQAGFTQAGRSVRQGLRCLRFERSCRARSAAMREATALGDLAPYMQVD
jgi:UDP-2,4-diacetamido-2,4,6-trideoxy-beta-L-altropyranose hydrolase